MFDLEKQLEKWEKEFLPTRKPRTWKDAMDATIKFWEGILPGNLKRYRIDFYSAREHAFDRVFILTSQDVSCFLCARTPYFNLGTGECGNCPVYKHVGYCLELEEYISLIYDQDPKPGLRVLRKIRKKMDK